MSENSNDKLAAAIWRLGRNRADSDAWRLAQDQLWPRLFATSFRLFEGDDEQATIATKSALTVLFNYSQFVTFMEYPDAFQSLALAACRALSLLLAKQKSEPGEAPREVGEIPATSIDVLARFSLWVDESRRTFLDLILEGYSVAQVAAELKIVRSSAILQILAFRHQLARLLRQ